MAKSKSTTKPRPATTDRQRKADQDRKGNYAYCHGCDAGYALAMQWLRDKKMNPVFCTDLQHMALKFIEDHQKARGAKREFVRGQVVGFFSTIEDPAQATAQQQYGQQQKEAA